MTQAVPDAPYGKAAGAAHRGLEVLELFSVEQRALTVSEVSSKLGFPQSSTSVLLRSLADLGYLRHDRRARTFLPTLRVSFLGMWLHQAALAQGNILEFMEMLASRSGHVAMLAMQNGLHAQYIHIVAARSSRVGLKPGLLRPLCRAATGKVLLSAHTDAEVRQLVRNINALDRSFPTPVDADELLEEVRECRKTGFAFSKESVNVGAAVIAARVPMDINGMPLAVGVGIHSWEVDQLRPFVMDLIAEAFALHFPRAQSRSIQRQRVAPRGGYAVTKTT